MKTRGKIVKGKKEGKGREKRGHRGKREGKGRKQREKGGNRKKREETEVSEGADGGFCDRK